MSGKTRYDRLSRLGRNGLAVDQTIGMPNVSTLLADAAWGDVPTGTFPAGINVTPGPAAGTLTTSSGNSVVTPKNVNGYYLTGGNISIIQMQHGNNSQFPIDQAALRGANNDNVSFLMRQGTTQRRMTQTYSNTTLNPGGSWTLNGTAVTGSLTVPANYTIIQNDTNTKDYKIMKEYGNGLFYSTDNIQGLEGMNKGRHTFAVDQMQNKEIYLTDELLRADITPGQKPATGQTRDQLGVVAYAIRFPTSRTNPFTGASAAIDRGQWPVNDPMLIYAALFAGRPNDPNNTDTTAGGVGAINYGSGTPGGFRVYGSLTENIRQAKGTFNASTGAPSTGMNYKYDYDTNFQNVQPPYFPAQSNFELKSWQDVPLTQDAN